MRSEEVLQREEEMSSSITTTSDRRRDNFGERDDGSLVVHSQSSSMDNDRAEDQTISNSGGSSSTSSSAFVLVEDLTRQAEDDDVLPPPSTFESSGLALSEVTSLPVSTSSPQEVVEAVQIQAAAKRRTDHGRDSGVKARQSMKNNEDSKEKNVARAQTGFNTSRGSSSGRGLTKLQFVLVGAYFVSAYMGISTFVNQSRITRRSSSSRSSSSWDEILSFPTSMVSSSVISASGGGSGTETQGNQATDAGGSISNSINNVDPERPLVMIVACTKSQPRWNMQPKEAFVFKHFLPSVVSSITSEERSKYRVEVMLAYDKGDRFWEKKKVRQWVRDKFPSLQINFVSILKDDQLKRRHRIPFNEACQAAYEYGTDYIVRVNDDTEFGVEGWITMGIGHLSRYQHKVGVVGPKDHVNSKILTHDMVHRTHLDIFDRYYPDEFDNWWIDDWITHVYGWDRTTMDENWTVINHSGGDTMRYKVNENLKDHLEPSIQHGSQKVEQYLAAQQKTARTRTATHDFCVLGTTRVAHVEGPMDRFVKYAAAIATTSGGSKFSNTFLSKPKFKVPPTGPCLSARVIKYRHENR